MKSSTLVGGFILVLAFTYLAALAPGQQVVNGALDDGSLYEFQLPTNWNGNLVLLTHEWVDPAEPELRLLPASSYPWSTILPNLRSYLLERGYAVGYSSYATNGWAVQSAVADTHELRGVFSNLFGKPERTYLAGVSMGSLAATKLAEHYPQQYSGVLALCGVLGGARAYTKYYDDARALYDLFFNPGPFSAQFEIPFSYTLPGDFAHPPTLTFGPTDPAFLGVYANLVQGMTGPYYPTLQFAATAQIPAQDVNELIEGSLWVIGGAILNGPDFLALTHEHLGFGNLDTVYHDPLAPELDESINTYVQRYQAQPDALLYLDHYYEPSGDLAIPMYTLHTTRDPSAPLWNEDMYADRVARRGYSQNLYQQSVDAFGHCALTTEQVTSAFDALTVWVTTGIRPE